MILLRKKLAELLAKQEIENAEYHADIGNDYLIQKISKENYTKRADEIIELFVDAIKGLEFTIQK